MANFNAANGAWAANLTLDSSILSADQSTGYLTSGFSLTTQNTFVDKNINVLINVPSTSIIFNSTYRETPYWQAGWMEAGQIRLANFSTSGSQSYPTLNEILTLESGGYLYISAGYVYNTKIPFSSFLSNSANVIAASMRTGYYGYDSNGQLIQGTLATYTGAADAQDSNSVALNSTYNGYMSKLDPVSITSQVSTITLATGGKYVDKNLLIDLEVQSTATPTFSGGGVTTTSSIDTLNVSTSTTNTSGIAITPSGTYSRAPVTYNFGNAGWLATYTG